MENHQQQQLAVGSTYILNSDLDFWDEQSQIQL